MGNTVDEFIARMRAKVSAECDRERAILAAVERVRALGGPQTPSVREAMIANGTMHLVCDDYAPPRRPGEPCRPKTQLRVIRGGEVE